MTTTTSWLPWVTSLNSLEPILFPNKRPRLLQRFLFNTGSQGVPFTRCQMLYGRDLRLPEDLLFSQPSDFSLAPEVYIKKLQARMEEMYHLARNRIGTASEKMKTSYDARATGHDFHEGN
ncbi:retrovirus-related Pol polyprotein from transposon 412 [Trichonephila clavipes]|nr:retrovirus-related Pol polyprotein from transposon 412 [Trichonephila clavipes]